MFPRTLCSLIVVFMLAACFSSGVTSSGQVQSQSEAQLKTVDILIHGGDGSIRPYKANVRSAGELSKHLLGHCVGTFRLGSKHEGETGPSYEDGSFSANSVTEDQLHWLVTAEKGETRWIEPSSYDAQGKCAS